MWHKLNNLKQECVRLIKRTYFQRETNMRLIWDCGILESIEPSDQFATFQVGNGKNAGVLGAINAAGP